MSMTRDIAAMEQWLYKHGCGCFAVSDSKTVHCEWVDSDSALCNKTNQSGKDVEVSLREVKAEATVYAYMKLKHRLKDYAGISGEET